MQAKAASHPRGKLFQAGEEVTELVLFGAQVGARMAAGARAAGKALNNVNAGFLELLLRVQLVTKGNGLYCLSSQWLIIFAHGCS